MPSASVDPISAPRAAPAGGILLRASGTPSPRLVMLGDIPCQVELGSAPRQARREWTHWDLSPGPAGREADMMPLRRPPSGTGGKETLSQHRRGMRSDSHRPKAKTTARGTDAQPDVRRVGGGRARTSPPPTAQQKQAHGMLHRSFQTAGKLLGGDPAKFPARLLSPTWGTAVQLQAQC